MDHRYNNAILLTVTLSCLLLSAATAVPTTRRLLSINSTAAPTAAPAKSELELYNAAKSRSMKEVSPDIINFCKGTENPTLCSETIEPSVSGTFNPVQALETEIKATLEKAKQIAGIISEKLNNPATDKNAMDALGICNSQYADMLDTIKNALQLVAQNNMVDAYSKFGAVISYKMACDDAFVESPGVQVPFAQHATALFQLGGNCNAIMDRIVNKH